MPDAANPVFSGCIPALMTPCDAAGTPDFTALANTGKELVDAGMNAVVYCGSMGDWPLLSDEQRMLGVEALGAAGLPVIVGTGAQITARARPVDRLTVERVDVDLGHTTEYLLQHAAFREGDAVCGLLEPDG